MGHNSLDDCAASAAEGKLNVESMMAIDMQMGWFCLIEGVGKLRFAISIHFLGIAVASLLS